MPEFRVGYAAKGGLGTASLPFPIYQIPHDPRAPWGESVIHIIAQDFFRGQQGVIFTIWDISRVGYIGWPHILADGVPSKPWLMSRPFKLWGYFPVDCINAGNRIHHTFVEAYNRYDRKLFYTDWACRAAAGSGVGGDVDWIPHGIQAGNGDLHGTRQDTLLVGCVGTNQTRKDWGLTFSTVAWLKDKLGNCNLWAHIDKEYVPGRWNLPSLSAQFGLQRNVAITTELSEQEMMNNYSNCDITIANGLGEGFGFPIAESLNCGTPVVHGDYAGAADWMRQARLENMLVKPVAFRLESEFGSVRPVYRPEDFGEKILEVLGISREKCREAVEHLHWDKLWPVWEKWFRKGL